MSNNVIKGRDTSGMYSAIIAEGKIQQHAEWCFSKFGKQLQDGYASVWTNPKGGNKFLFVHKVDRDLFTENYK